MKTIHVLIVEDDPITQKRLSNELARAGYQVTVAPLGRQVIPILSTTPIDAVILDVNLPDGDGFSVMADIRRNSSVPILMATVRSAEVDQMRGLENGADDYMIKPLSGRELLARLRNILRRSASSNSAPKSPPQRYVLDALVLDIHQRVVTDSHGDPVPLPDRLFELLQTFAANSGRPLSRSWLHETINKQEWTPTNRSIDIQVSRLRSKLEEAAPGFSGYIKPVRNVGYRFTGDVKPE